MPPPLSSPLCVTGKKSFRELSFKKGDIIYIRRQIDKNWYEGEHNAMIGLLPVQYVDVRIQCHIVDINHLLLPTHFSLVCFSLIKQ